MSARPLEWQGNPKVPRADLVVPVTKTEGATGEEGTGEVSKNQLKKLEKQRQAAEKKAEKEAAKAAKAAEGS